MNLYDLTPEQEAAGWRYAERLGLIDSIGGAEWQSRVEKGLVSLEALSLLEQRVNTNAEVFEGGIAEFDQNHATALETLRNAKSFFLVTFDVQTDGGTCRVQAALTQAAEVLTLHEALTAYVEAAQVHMDEQQDEGRA
jgi:hypothetical protein